MTKAIHLAEAEELSHLLRKTREHRAFLLEVLRDKLNHPEIEQDVAEYIKAVLKEEQ